LANSSGTNQERFAEKNVNEMPRVVEALTPEIYMPSLQFFIRLLLGFLACIYFNYIQIPLLVLTIHQINLIIISYYVFHIFGWWYYKKYGAKFIMIRLGSWIDILGAFIATVFDPFSVPPMMILFLIAVLGNGIQHGLRAVGDSMMGAIVFCITALVIHYIFLGHWPPYSLYFYFSLIAVGVIYSYVLARRLELIKKDAIAISEKDPLTGIGNRRSFLKKAEYLLNLNERYHLPLVFVFADLDNFKAINDQFGHEMGDRVLKCFSEMAKSRFRKSDVIARYGGDEFVMILTNTSLRDTELAVQGLQHDFRDWAINNGLPVDFSFGLEMIGYCTSGIDDVLRRADAALYDAKIKKRKTTD